MPMPNRTTVSSEVSDWSTWKPMVSAARATRAVASVKTRPMVAIGSSAATGLRKMAPTRTMMSTRVASRVTDSAVPNDSSVSTQIAASPVSPAWSPLPSSPPAARSRSCGTASLTGWSLAVPWNTTWRSWTPPLGATCSGPVTTAATRGIRAAIRSWASAPTLAWSAGVSWAPSARLTTRIAVVPEAVGNACSASCWAWTDSLSSGMKLAWSALETSASEGEKGTMRATAITQTAITRHGWLVTSCPSLANICILP